MFTLRKILMIACVTALAAFGVAACGSEKSEGGGGGKGAARSTSRLTSFPDYVDPQLSYTVEGWEVLWNVYTPLLTYKHVKGKEGTQVVPGLAEDMPEISRRRQDVQAQAAAEHEVLGRHPDQGVRFRLRHPAAVQGRLRRLGVLRRHRRRHRLRRGQGPERSAASRPTTTPATSPSR